MIKRTCHGRRHGQIRATVDRRLAGRLPRDAHPFVDCHWLSKSTSNKPSVFQQVHWKMSTWSFKVTSDAHRHELITDLGRLRDEILITLDLPVQKQPVVVYLFSDENRYAQYLQTRYPMLPPRRALFLLGSAKELGGLYLLGRQDSGRHAHVATTHGVASCHAEGCAFVAGRGVGMNIFEVTDQPSGLNRDYARNLAAGIASGWKPDLDRLEGLETVDQMQKSDYQESWAWVHFLLNHNEISTSKPLTNYLRGAETTSQPGRLSSRLRAAIPIADTRLYELSGRCTDGIVRVGALKLH